MKILERTLWAVGLALLGWVAFVQADGWLFQTRAEASLEQALSRPEETPGASVGETEESPEAPPLDLAPGDPVGRIEIPRLGLSVMIAEGTEPGLLRKAVGHLPGSPLPGASGNVAVAGHRDRHFRPLKDVAPGDEVLLTTPGGTFRYRVDWTRIVAPEDIYVLDATEEPTLTLLTCYPFYFVGNAPERFVVRARQIGWRPPDASDVQTAGAGGSL